VGRANAGKTSLMMHLTGTVQRPVNFPGSSVERCEVTIRAGDQELCVVDLPGIAALEPISRDEAVALDYLRGGVGRAPDTICAVLDATRLAVELRFLLQLRQLGLPLVVALTKTDVATRNGDPVDVARLQRALGLPLLAVDGRTGAGASELRALLASATAVAPLSPPLASPELPLVERTRAGRTQSDRIDAFLLHPVLGPLALVAVLGLAFQAVFFVAEPFMRAVEFGQESVGGWLEHAVPAGWLQSFLVDGLVNGLGTVLLFVPQIALLIAFVSMLEASGYMARAVFLLDRLLRKVGLTGKSFVPLSSSFACAIPAILATRIITDERDRLATIAVAPLMSCSARLPVYVVLLAAFFPPAQAGLLLFLLYLLGIVAAFVVAFVLRRTILRGGSSMLAMEMPVYHRPRLRFVARHVWLSVREFLRTAGTVILAATVLVWLLGYFPRPAAIGERYDELRAAAPVGPAGDGRRDALDNEEAAAYLQQSWLASIGRAVQPAFAPAGFDWRLTVGVLAAFPARELVVPTLGTLHSLGELEADTDVGSESVARLRTALRNARDPDGHPAMTSLVALAAMAFFALCSQCASTLAAIRRETHSWFWPVFVFCYMTGLAWTVAVAIYQFGRLLGYE
ncbi:MAG: ferrous iron transport protein B, partial [Planctomycetes bacterium]|nr:ferrous iron transport protein B [Planctomycetota bacterium]